MDKLFSKEVERAGKNTYIAVRQFPTYFELLALEKHGALLGKFCGTIQELAIEHLSRKLIKKKLLSDQQRLLLVAKAVERATGKPVKDMHYAQIIDRRIRDLVQHSVGEDEIREAIKHLPSLSTRLKATVKILETYRELLKSLPGTDLPHLFSLAASAVESLPDVSLVFPLILFPPEIDFLKKSRHVKVFTFKLNRAGFFRELAESALRALPEDWNVEKLQPNSLSGVLKEGDERVKTPTTVYVRGFSTRSEDAKLIVDSVMTFLENGYKPHEIAVVGDSTAEIVPLLHSLFSERGIPFNFQTGGIPLTASPSVKSKLYTMKETEEKRTLLEWLEWTAEGEHPPAVAQELELFYSELLLLERADLLPKDRMNGRNAFKTLRFLFSGRHYGMFENEPYGVHVCSPESVVSLMPKVIVMDDVSEGVYPRSFPFDPDFSYAERELINKALGRTDPYLQAFPQRDRLIAYDFLTMFNILSLPLKALVVTYSLRRGKSLLAEVLHRKVEISKPLKKVVSTITANCHKAYKGIKAPETREERGIVAWRLREERPEHSFRIDKELAKKLVSRATVTSVVEFLDCPVKALLSLAFPARKKMTFEQFEGTLYHECIRRMLKDSFDGETFEEVFSELAELTEDPLVELMKPHFKDNLKRFLATFSKHELCTGNTKQEEEVTVRMNDIEVKGKADFVSEINRTLHIVDFKTGTVGRNYLPPSPKSLQVILYGVAFKGADIRRAVAEGMPDTEFHFVSVAKANPNTPEEKWMTTFSGKEHAREVKRALILAFTAVVAMKNGLFFPHKVEVRKDSAWMRIKDEPCIAGYSLTYQERKKLERKLNAIAKHILRQAESA